MKESVTFKLAETNQFGRAGQTVTLSLEPDDVHDPTELPTFLAGYKPFGFRADEASPAILVDHDKDKYRVFDKENVFRRVDVKGAFNGEIPEVDPKSSLADYAVVDRFVGSFINAITEQNATGAYRPRQAAMKRCQRAISLDREWDVFRVLLVDDALWDAQNVVTLSASQKWNGGSAADPIADLHNMIERSAQQVTDVWMNQLVANTFLRDPKVKDHMKQFLGDGAPGAAVATVAQAATRNIDFAIPGLPPIHVAASKVLNEATTELDYVLENAFVVLESLPPGVPTDGEEIATSYTYRRRGVAGVGFETREFRVEGRGPKGGTMVVVSQADIAKIAGNNCGGLLKDVIQ